MREPENRPPEDQSGGLGAVLSGWVIWAAIVAIFGAWAGLQSFAPETPGPVAGAERRAAPPPADHVLLPPRREDSR